MWSDHSQWSCPELVFEPDAFVYWLTCSGWLGCSSECCFEAPEMMGLGGKGHLASLLSGTSSSWGRAAKTVVSEPSRVSASVWATEAVGFFLPFKALNYTTGWATGQGLHTNRVTPPFSALADWVHLSPWELCWSSQPRPLFRRFRTICPNNASSARGLPSNLHQAAVNRHLTWITKFLPPTTSSLSVSSLPLLKPMLYFKCCSYNRAPPDAKFCIRQDCPRLGWGKWQFSSQVSKVMKAGRQRHVGWLHKIVRELDFLQLTDPLSFMLKV